MSIIVKDVYGDKKRFYCLENMAENMLDGNDNNMGSLEALEATARNNSQAIGRLVEVLLDKGIIDSGNIGVVLADSITISICFEK